MASLDEIAAPARFFEARRKVFPRKVDGTFRRLKWAIMAATLAVYYVTPWLRWDRGEFAPDQAVLVDLAHRRFYMFAIEIWPHEFYYVAGLLIMAGIGLFLVTSAVGRAWCGYACPQTVWTDLFVHVERFIEGDRNAQLRMEASPWTVGKLAKRMLKFAVWLLIAAATGGAWIFYFADAPTLARQFVSGSAPLVAYSTVGVLTFTTFTLGGLMREQVCIYMCPWPRIQSAMMDERSLTVTYKSWRGEPRTHGLKRVQAPDPGANLRQRMGDCIDCDACVAVCPTGIDIREGAQIGCITCGLCIDACDAMMAKLARPPRLIGYTTELDARADAAGGQVMDPLRRMLRPRTLSYSLVWIAIGCGMLFAVSSRQRLELSVAQARNPLFVRQSDGEIRNAYTVKVRNMEARPRSFLLSFQGINGKAWNDAGAPTDAGRQVRIDIPADRVGKTTLYLAAAAAGPKLTPITVIATPVDDQSESVRDNTVFERPEAR